MKIAIFTEYYFPFISGVVTHIKTLKDGLEKQGHEVLIVTTDPKSLKHYVKDGILYCPAKGIKKIYGYGVTLPISLKRLKYLKEFNPDIIHIHTEFTIGIFGMWVAKMLHKPMVYTLHTMYDDYLFYIFPERFDKYAKPATHAYFRNVAKRATEIIGPSLKVVEFLKRCGVDRHINVIPNITDLTLFLPENVNWDKVRTLKEQYNITDGCITMCFVGRLGKEKSIDVLIDYLSRMENKDKYRLFIIGDGPESRYLKELAVKKQVNDIVFFAGKVNHNEIAAYYYASDIYATASVTEMNSISMLEAMASGLMVLQRFDVYNKDQIVQGKNGYLFHDFEEFHRLLNEFSQLDKQQREELRASAAAFSRRYGPDEFIEKVVQVYEIALHKYKNMIK